MKQKLLLLLTMMMVGVSGVWADGDGTTHESAVGHLISFSDFSAMSGTGKRFGLMMVNTNESTQYKWCTFAGSDQAARVTNTLTKSYLWTLEGSDNSYKLKNCDSETYISTSNPQSRSDAAGAASFALNNFHPTDGCITSEYTNDYHISFWKDNNSSSKMNCWTNSYMSGSGSWVSYAAYGPYYIVDINFKDADGNVIKTALDDAIVISGYTPTVSGYKLKTDPTSGNGITADGSYTFVYEKIPTVVSFGNATGVSGLTTDAFHFNDVTNPSGTLSDGNTYAFTTSTGADLKFWSGNDGKIEGTWANTVAIEDINTELAPETNFSAEYFSANSSFLYTATGNGGTNSYLTLGFPQRSEGEKVVLYASLARRSASLDNFTVSGLSSTKIKYATNSGSGFSDTQAFSADEDGYASPITLVKITGILTSTKSVTMSSTSDKNGWQIAAYTFTQPSIYTVSGTETLSGISNYSTYDRFDITSDNVLNVDVADFDLSLISGTAGTINVTLADNTKLTTARSQAANFTGTKNFTVTGNVSSALTTASNDNVTYTGGAGSSSSRVSIAHNGGTATLTGGDKTYYLSETTNDTQTTVNFDGTTVNYGDAFGIGKATYNVNNTAVTAAKFVTSQGGGSRDAVVNLTGNTKITVSGNTIADANTNSVMIGHWNGSSNVTLSGTAEIEAANTQLLVGKTGNTQTITVNDNAVIDAKGIYVSGSASGTNTFNLNGGELQLGSIGFTGASGKTMTINVGGNAKISAKESMLPISQPITVAEGNTLTIDGGAELKSLVNLTGTVTNNGTIKFVNATVEGGELRDCSTLPYTYEGCTLIVNETTADFNTAEETITITNIPSGITSVKLRRADRRYVTLTITDGSATFSDNSAKVSGPAAWLDYTFTKETLAEREVENTGYIVNSGSAGSNATLQYDSGYSSTNSYNKTNGALLAKSTPWRNMTDDYAWPTEYSVAVYANVPDVEKGCLMTFGTIEGNYLSITRGESSDEILLMKGSGTGNAATTVASMAAENATTAKHLIIFTKSGTTFKVYCDGVLVANTTYDATLGGGFQIGSIHGGIYSSGITRISNISDDNIKSAVEIGAIRIFNTVLTSDQMGLLMKEFPYTSKGGTYSRTITESANLSAENAWTAEDETTVDLPAAKEVEGTSYNPTVNLTTNADATLTVNANATFGKLTFAGTNTLTVASSDAKSVDVTGSIIVNSDVTVKYGAIDFSKVPVTVGEGKKLTFDFTDYDFNKVYTTKKIQLTGLIAQDDEAVLANGLPTDNSTRTCSFGFADNHYWLTITVRAAQNVYAPAGTTEIKDNMPVKLTADAETNDGLLIRGDVLVFNSAETIKFNQTSGFCTFDIQAGDGNTVTVNNKTNDGYALDGETITITSGTLKINNGSGDAKINSATINISENGTLDNYGWLTVDGTLTVNTDYTKTIFNNSGSEYTPQIRGVGKIVKGGNGTVTMRAMPHCDNTSTVHPIEITGGTLILGNGAKAGAVTGTGTLSVAAGNKVTVASMASNTKLAGAGTLALSAFTTTGPDKTSWTGAVEFPATDADQGDLAAKLNAWGTANSKIILHNVGTTGSKGQGEGTYLSNATVIPTVEIAADATVYINNGSTSGDATGTFTKLTGAGTLAHEWNAEYKVKVATLTDFTGTLSAANSRTIEVANLVLAEAPQVDQLLIKTSGTVTLSKLTIGTIESSAYTWETKEVEEVNGIYVTAFNNVAQKRDEANAVVKPYADYIGEGVGKYTITLGENKYTTMASYTEAVNAWTSVEDYVAPTVAINPVPAGFYRFASANNGNAKTNAGKYLTPKSDGTGYTYNETADASNILYYDGEGFVIRLDNGYALKGYNNSKELKATLVDFDNGDYRWRFSENTNGATKGKYALKYNGSWYLSDTGWGYDANPSADACWTIEPVTELPLTFKSTFLGYSTFCSPVPVTIPENTSAYVCKKNENTLTFYQITAIKDANDNVTIPANTAVLLYNSTVSDENVSVTFPVTEYKGKVNNNSLEGTLATVTFSSSATDFDWYSLRTSTVNETAMVGFYKKTAGDTRAGFKAWLKTEHTTEARNFTIFFDGEEGQTTGLVEVLGLQNAEIYDLSGRKLSTVKNGINIVNGKKIIK